MAAFAARGLQAAMVAVEFRQPSHGAMVMPDSYKCPKGGQHEWHSKKTPQGMGYKVCKKCGQAKPS